MSFLGGVDQPRHMSDAARRRQIRELWDAFQLKTKEFEESLDRVGVRATREAGLTEERERAERAWKTAYDAYDPAPSRGSRRQHLLTPSGALRR